MKNSIKIVLVIILLIPIGGISLFYWHLKWSPEAKKASLNVYNSEKLYVGMNLEEALLIMGEPTSITNTIKDSSIQRYYYIAPFMASAGIRFEVDSTNKLISIEEFE